jgi:hypothetical protein
MEGLVKGLIDLIRSSVKYASVVVLASGILLFVPANWLAKIRVDQFVDKYGDVIGLVFVVSGSFVLIEPLSWLGGVLKSTYVQRKQRKVIESVISELDEREKAVLREFYIENKRTLVLSVEHPVVEGLISEGILEVVGSQPLVWDIGRGYHRFSVRIRSEVSCYLSPVMLGMPSGPTEEELQDIRRRRPDFL